MQKQTKQTNYWRIAAVTLFLLLAIYLITLQVQKQKQDDIMASPQYSFLTDLDFLSKVDNPDYFVALCNVKTNKCERVGR